MSEVLYNLALALIGAGTLITQRRRLPGRGLMGFLMALVGLGLVLGFYFHQDEPLDPMFAAMRLWSYGLFLHLPAVCVCWAWLDRASRPRAARLLAALGVSMAAIGIDAFLIEPTWLEVTELELRSPKVTRPLTIAVLADIQSDEIGEHERAAVRAAVASKPDLVLLPGDYIQAKTTAQLEREGERLRALFVEEGLSARLGVYAVGGNVDNIETWPKLFEGTGVHTSTGTAHPTPEVSVTTLSLTDSFRTDVRVPAAPGFHVVVGHGPDFSLGNVEGDLLVAGHTHGGQVRIPFWGPLVTLSKVPRAWAAGLTKLSGGQSLVVSRGIGLERGLAPRMRFLCRPEVVVIRVQSE